MIAANLLTQQQMMQLLLYASTCYTSNTGLLFYIVRQLPRQLLTAATSTTLQAPMTLKLWFRTDKHFNNITDNNEISLIGEVAL